MAAADDADDDDDEQKSLATFAARPPTTSGVLRPTEGDVAGEPERHEMKLSETKAKQTHQVQVKGSNNNNTN